MKAQVKIKSGKLRKAGFYYKTQGLVLDESDWKIQEMISSWEKSRQDWKQDFKENGTSHHFMQLELILANMKRRGHADFQETVLWCMNVYFLTEFGYIKNDNWNGLQFITF